MFLVTKFDDWKICMSAHMAALHDEMKDVLLEGSSQ